MSGSQQIPILFIVGLSGAGKTHLGQYLQDNLNFIHVEQDTADGDVIDILGIRNEWDNYLHHNISLELGDSLRKMAKQENKYGLVMTFTSLVRFSLENVKCAEKAGIITRILYGTKAECLNSYLEREQMTGRGYSRKRWAKYNN